MQTALPITVIGLGLVLLVGAGNTAVAAGRPKPDFLVKSTIDGEEQPCLFFPAKGDEPRPLVVFLHPWSNGFNTWDTSEWQAQAAKRNWHMLQPHFRGPNNNPKACASREARQDVLDAVDYVCAHYKVDPARIYVTGASGGGHMTMVMAAHAPDRWAAASAWCGISDLTAWHAESKAANRKYYKDIEGVVGGAPGDSPEVDQELRYRSPVLHIANAKDLPVDIATGIHDGHTGSVPIHHTIDAFNAIAEAAGAPKVTPGEIATLSKEQPLSTEEEQDPSFGRHIFLRRHAGPSRVTIFEGGHEGIAEAAFVWLEQHAKE